MFSIKRLKRIWKQEIENYDGDYAKPEPVFKTGDYHSIEPRIQYLHNKLYPENYFENLEDNPDPTSFIQLNPDTGELSVELKSKN